MTAATPTLQHPKTGLRTPVKRLDSRWQLTRGAIGRGVGSGLWFDFADGGQRVLHMVGVSEPICALWLVDGYVTRIRHLRPWVGAASAPATDVLELPADSDMAQAVSVGDEVVLA